MNGPWVVGAIAQNLWSFAGDADRDGVSVATVQPFLTYLLPEGWAVNLTSESTCNWNATAGNEWTVPLTVGASKVVESGAEFVNLGLAYVNYLERPPGAVKSEIRFSATYVWR